MNRILVQNQSWNSLGGWFAPIANLNKVHELDPHIGQPLFNRQPLPLTPHQPYPIKYFRSCQSVSHVVQKARYIRKLIILFRPHPNTSLILLRYILPNPFTMKLQLTLTFFGVLASAVPLDRRAGVSDTVNDMTNIINGKDACAPVAVIFARGTFDSG
jgi:hypothetical protein